MISIKGAMKINIAQEPGSRVTLESLKLLQENVVKDSHLVKPIKEEDLHVTLLLPSSLKPYRFAFDDLMVDDGSDILDVDDHPYILPGSNVFTVLRNGTGGAKDKVAYFCLLHSQLKWQCFMRELRSSFGLPPELEADRIFHVSIANRTGSPFDSVGDVCLEDIVSG